MVAGVGLFGTFTGFVASWFVGGASAGQAHEIAQIRDELAQLRRLLPTRQDPFAEHAGGPLLAYRRLRATMRSGLGTARPERTFRDRTHRTRVSTNVGLVARVPSRCCPMSGVPCSDPAAASELPLSVAVSSPHPAAASRTTSRALASTCPACRTSPTAMHARFPSPEALAARSTSFHARTVGRSRTLASA